MASAAANRAIFITTHVANTLATLAAIACAGNAMRAVTVTQTRITDAKNRIARNKKRGPESEPSKPNNGEVTVAMATRIDTNPAKRVKLKPVLQYTPSSITYASPVTTIVPATPTHTISTGRGSKHCRDYSIADRKGKKGKMKDSE